MRKTFPSRKKPKRRDPTRAALFLIAAVVGAGTVLSALFRTRPETFEAVPAAEVFREKASPENPKTPLPPRPAPKAPTENIPKKTPPAFPAAVPKKTPTPVPAAKIPAPAPKTPKPAPQKTKAKSKPAPANPYANVPALFGYGADMPPATRAFDASVELLAQRRDFSAFAAALGEKVKDAAASASLIRKGNLNAAMFRRLRNLKRATEICRVIDMAGTENLERFFRLPPAAAGTQADRIRADFLQWFFSRRKNGSSPVQKFLYAFYETGGDPRNADHAVRKLFELWTGTPEDDREPYANLMLAFALAHPSVEHARSRVRKPDGAILSPREVYDYFRDADRRGRLIGDVRRMSVSELSHELFRQIKVFVAPLTPPNYEIEKAVDLILAQDGLKTASLQKRKNTPQRKKSAAASARSQRYKYKNTRKKKDNARSSSVQPADISQASSSAEAHDL